MEDRLNCQISSLVKYHQNPNKKVLFYQMGQ